MGPVPTKRPAKLSARHRELSGSTDATEKPVRDHKVEFGATSEIPDSVLKNFFDRHEALRQVPAEDTRRAWFTMAHLLLAPGAKVVEIGSGLGNMTFAMAVLHPELTFIGIEPDRKKLAKAQKTWELPNLSFRHGDLVGTDGIETESVDAIISSFVMHRIYSEAKFSERAVMNALEKKLSLLKTDGQLFLRDYALPPHGSDYILMEMPDKKGAADTVAEMSEADLLVWYAENALAATNGCHGFFLEELPKRVPNTRLFRLPFKWACEFINRKDNRAELEEEIGHEYAFLTTREFRRALRRLGSRVLYSSPHWDDMEIQEKYSGRFRLYGEDGAKMGPPPTSYVAVAQKIAEKDSVQVHERRTSSKTDTKIQIRAMRNDLTGKIHDVVSRDIDMTEIIPYRIGPNGRLSVFVHEGLPRAIVNAVPRNGREIDGKRWSGHMTEAISVPTDKVLDVALDEAKPTVIFARDYLGLRAATGHLLEDGPSFFPAPDFIDEHIKTRYLMVQEADGPVVPKSVHEDISGFTTQGRIREVDAQGLLDAITVGYLPNSRLELQVQALFDRMEMEAETWEDCPLSLATGDPDKTMDLKGFASKLAEGDKRFRAVKGTAGELRSIRSVFIDEGWVEGGVSGMAARDMEFVIHDDNTLNRAVVIPLTRDLQGQVMAGLCTEFLPVPQRYMGNGMTMRAPTFPLPKEVTTIEQAKIFVAEQFGVTPDKVARLGESYFSHIGVTPQRIFPFAVASSKAVEAPLGGPVQFAPLKTIWRLIDRNLSFSMDVVAMAAMRKVIRRMGYDNDQNLKWATGHANIYTRENPTLGSYTDLGGRDVTASSPTAAVTEKPDTASVATAEEKKKFYIK